ncbi:transducin beta-like protein 3 [Mercenaria mercenaria]|uniref:transducin beta-like protein 3 n=1 Tax=Mercenaria mercenaria TaxID=6596 RepID=UPI00234F70CC|nr:transducin beta-like protein 3 [Mercenaria mercenaria]
MSQLKTSFGVKSKFEAFYTGGKIQVSSDGVYMFCGCGNRVNVLEVETGKVHITIGQEEDEEITSFCLTPNDQYVILATQQLLLRQWDWKEQKLVRTWKAIHFAPVVSMTFDCTSTLLATGSADSTIKIWDVEKQYCTHNLRGHQGIISIVAFHPDISRLLLYTAGEDYKIRVWDLKTSKCIAEVAAHYSLVTCVDFSVDGSSVYTTGRDGVVRILDTETHAIRKTIPVFEVVESVVLLPENVDYPAINVDGESVYFITAGNKGNLRLWNSDSGKCVFTTDAVHSTHQISVDTSAKPDTEDHQNIVQMVFNKQKNNITVVTYDQNISILGLEKLRLQKQFAGNNDEILDVKYFGEDEKYAVVATNSMHIKVFQLSNCDCEILYGHTDIVLSIDVVPKADMFISGAKDSTVRLWKINPTLKQVSCLAVGQGHTHAVGAVAMSRAKPKFFVTGSEDCTLKLWEMPDDLDPVVTKEMHANVTEKAHDKTICSVVVAPNDKFIASGSMDKTAKLWKASNLSLIGVMRGHKKGIWCVEFSPVDQILATSSGDGTVKLWSLADFSCVRTFEGHDCAVLKVTFITRGMQLLTSGTNGLVKLWTIKNNECVKTMDEHDDKVWAMAIGEAEDSFITGGADSNLIIWKDVTETEQNEVRQKQEQFILQDQELSNLIQQKKYLKAIGLAITLEQPFRLLNILKEILSEEAGDDKLYSTLEKLRMDQIDALLRFAVKWNTNSRHCHEAQVVLSSVIKMYPPKQLKELGNLKSSVEGLLPYTERHFNRMTRLVQQAMFLEYTWQCMKGISSNQPGAELEPATLGTTADAGTAGDSSDSSSESEPESVTENIPKAASKDKKADKSEDKSKLVEAKLPADQPTNESSSSESDEDMVETIEKSSKQQKKQSIRLKQQKEEVTKSKETSTKYDSKKAEKLKRLGLLQDTVSDNVKSDDKKVKLTVSQKAESSESDEESNSESEKENDFGVMKDRQRGILTPVQKRNKGGEHDSESESDSDSDENDTLSSAVSEKEVHRTVHEKASTGKRLDKGSSLEDSSESDDSSDSEESELESGQSAKAAPMDMEDEESKSDTGGVSEENIKKNLFKGYITRGNIKGSGNKTEKVESQGNKTSSVRGGQKRKMTDAYTVVKDKTPKVVDMQYFIDRKADIKTKVKDDIGNKQKPRQQSRKVTKADKLKKLKKPAGR